MAKTIKTKIGNNIKVVEHFFTADGNDHVAIYVENITNKKREYIGTSFDKVSYAFNSKYVIFTSEDGIEIVFDIDAFDFITDEIGQMKAYSKLLKSSMIEKTKNENDVEYDLFKEITNRRVLEHSEKTHE